MKKILSLMLVLVMVMSLGEVSFSAQEDAPITESATNDEASFDEASVDEEAFGTMVFDYILTLTNGDNPFESMKRPYLAGVKIPHEFDLVYLSDSDVSSRFGIVDINFPEEESFEVGDCSIKVGNSIIINEVHNLVVPVIGMGYFVVFPDENKVVQLRDALLMDVEGLKEICLEKGIVRLLGDADGDCNITIKDATYIQKVAAGFEGYKADKYIGISYGSFFADFNGDLTVNVKDATSIQKLLAVLPFDFMGQYGVEFTEIPKDAQPLEIEVVTEEPSWEYAGLVAEFITSTDEYLSVTGKTSEVYNEGFFDKNNLVYVKKGYGSGSYSLDILGAYMWEQDTIFVDSRFMTAAPGSGVTDDVVCYVAFISVDKSVTENVDRVVVYEDKDFYINRAYY